MKTFRSYDQDQMLLMPPSVSDWVSDDHVARMISEIVDHQLDVSLVMASYDELRGYPPYDPRMLLKVLLLGYCCGIFSSRKLAEACRTHTPFMFLAALQHPDFRTIAAFRKRHLEIMDDLFDQVLSLCDVAGLVKLGHVSVDGSKFKANASKSKAMSYGRIAKEMLEQAEAIDAAEDELYGDTTPYEMPEHLRDPKERRRRLDEAKTELERRAREKNKDAKRESTRSKPPKDTDQYNFTDPESRIMKDGATGGFVQAYNVQNAVDDTEHHIIVATDVSNQAADNPQLLGVTDQIERRLGRKPKKLSADAGYNAEDNLDGLAEREIDAYIAIGGRESDLVGDAPRGPIPKHYTTRERMARKLKTKQGKAVYKRRKHVAEPVFGETKHARGFRQFHLRGEDNVRGENKLVALTHNLRRLHASGRYRPSPA